MNLRTALILALSCCLNCEAEAASPRTCQASVESSRNLAIAFYTKALIEKQPLAAFEKYASLDFEEHKPDVPNGERGAIAKFLESLIKALPEAKWEIVRTVAEKDFVVLHAKFTPAPGAPPYAIADFFRIKNCSVIEHWDVVEPPRDGMPNQISQF